MLYDNDTGVELLTYVQQLINDGLAVDVGDNAGGYDNLLKLADEKEPAAMTIATSASLGPVIAILDGGQFPQIAADRRRRRADARTEGANGAIVGGASMWITDSGNDAKAAAAWDFLQYLTSAQPQSTFSAATGYIAVARRRPVARPAEDDAGQRPALRRGPRPAQPDRRRADVGRARCSVR